MPERIQLRRTKGWRLPLNAKSVARPGPWGNPFGVVVDNLGRRHIEVVAGPPSVARRPLPPSPQERADLVRLYRETAAGRTNWRLGWTAADARAELAGRDLACWCPLPEPGEIDWCHAAVLIAIANEPP